MPAKSKSQFRFFEAAKHSPAFARKAGISAKVASDFTAGDKNPETYKRLPEKAKKPRFAKVKPTRGDKSA